MHSRASSDLNVGMTANLQHARSRSVSITNALNDPRLSALLYQPVTQSPNRIRFERRVKRYFYQLQKGCSQLQSCDFKLCASNPNFRPLTKEVAAIMSVQLASNSSTIFCPRIPADPEIIFDAFSLAQFDTPPTSPSASATHSRQQSVDSTQNFASPKPFLQSLFSGSSFTSLFTNRKELKQSKSSDSLDKLAASNTLASKKLDIPSIARIESSTAIHSSASSIHSQYDGMDDGNQNLALRSLNYDTWMIAVETTKMSDGESDYTFLLNSIYTVFSNIECLSKSFISRDVIEADPELDVLSLQKFYRSLLALEAKELHVKQLLRAINLIIGKLGVAMGGKNARNSGLLRILYILILNPLNQQQEYFDILTSKICELFDILRSKNRQFFQQWFSKLDEQTFKNLIYMFKSIVERNPLSNLVSDKSLVGAVKALSTLSHANESGSRPIVPLSEFYAYELYPKLNFKEEYRKWKQSLEKTSISDFAFFNYPFLFDPISKTRIMHIDAMVKMAREYEDACLSQALVLQTQKFLENPTAIKDLQNDLKESSRPHFVLEVRREYLIEDVMQQVSKKMQSIRKPLKVKFVGGGEQGMDQGGVQKEFFQILITKLLDPEFGLFEYDPETRYSHINGHSYDPLVHFEFFGIILGLALYNGVMVRLPFPPLFYKKLLHETITLEDVSEAYPELGKGLNQLLEWSDGDVGDIFMRTFEISYDYLGTVEHIPLIENGSEVYVTNANRVDYVARYVEHLTSTHIKSQFEKLESGFQRVIGGKVLSICRPLELELMLCGNPTSVLDFERLEQGATYDDGYSTSHTVIKWFWTAVKEMNLEHKHKLLEFVTASDRIPLNGLGSLTFVIQRNGPDSDKLPTALTCFGRLLLPEYDSYDKLKDRLITAIENSKGFGLV